MNSAELATQLGLTLDGPSRPICGAAPLDSASPEDLVFAASASFFDSARNSRAITLIAPPTYRPALHQSVIRSTSPRADFARALDRLYPRPRRAPGIHADARVHPTAHVDPTAYIEAFVTIGEHARIGPRTAIHSGAHIGAHSAIGADCLIHPGVVIYHNVQIADRVTLHAGCVLGADGFGFAPENGRWIKFPQVGRVVVEDDVEIGAHSCVDRAALGVTRIGEGSKLDNMVHVGHNCTVGRHVVIAAQSGLSGGVTIGDGAVIGGQVGIGDKARIEPGVILSSGAGVLTSKIVHAGEPLWGTPARPLRQYLKQLAALARLPELRRELKQIRDRLDRLDPRP